MRACAHRPAAASLAAVAFGAVLVAAGAFEAPEGRRRRYRLRAQEPAGPALRRALDGRYAEAIGALEHRRFATERHVHDARTAVKRLRSALRLARDELGEGTYREQTAILRAAARPLGASRDATALAATLASLAERFTAEVEPSELARVRRRLEREDAGAHDGVDAAARTALDRLRDGRDGLAAGGGTLDAVTLATLRRALRRSYRRGRAARRRAARTPSVENLHAWRRRVKDLRHHAELLREADPHALRRVRRRARRLSDLLGDDHDLAVLRERAASCPVTLALIDRRRRELQEAAFELGERLYARPPKRFARRALRRARRNTAWRSRR